jgi:signal transduction histidine kinase
MAIAVAIALLGAMTLARSQGRRLAEPVSQLARHAEDLGRGEFRDRPEPSGVSEVDTVATALAASGERLASLVARERRFSADVAHQLRTPLAGLRLRLERLAAEAGASPELAAVLDEVGRLEATVEHLLALTREHQPIARALDTAPVLDALTDRWDSRIRSTGRRLIVDDAIVGPVRGSFVSISQVLDVLVDNALVHGSGDIRIRTRSVTGGGVIEVSDDGAGPAEGIDAFERSESGGHGIGLGLARRIAEAEGGRLLLASPSPPSFHLVLPSAEH